MPLTIDAMKIAVIMIWRPCEPVSEQDQGACLEQCLSSALSDQRQREAPTSMSRQVVRSVDEEAGRRGTVDDEKRAVHDVDFDFLLGQLYETTTKISTPSFLSGAGFRRFRLVNKRLGVGSREGTKRLQWRKGAGREHYAGLPHCSEAQRVLPLHRL